MPLDLTRPESRKSETRVTPRPPRQGNRLAPDRSRPPGRTIERPPASRFRQHPQRGAACRAGRCLPPAQPWALDRHRIARTGGPRRSRSACSRNVCCCPRKLLVGLSRRPSDIGSMNSRPLGICDLVRMTHPGPNLSAALDLGEGPAVISAPPVLEILEGPGDLPQAEGPGPSSRKARGLHTRGCWRWGRHSALARADQDGQARFAVCTRGRKCVGGKPRRASAP